MKNCLLVGNCQTGPILSLITQNRSFSETYKIIPLPPIHAMDEKALSGAGLFDNIDLVFSQQIFNEKFGIFHTKNLKKICSEKGIRFVHVFNAYFEGYYPCVIHMYDVVILKHRVPISQDAIVFYSFTKGLEIDAACKLWKTISSSSAMKDFSRKTCAASIKELVQREKIWM